MVRIVLDSASDIPKNLQEKHGILTVPLQVTIGEEHYRDWVDLTPDVLYDRLEKEDIVPVASQPITTDWYPVLDGCRERGEDVLILTLSSALSGTYSGAMLAVKEYEDLKIAVCDCRTGSLGVTMIALALAKMSDEGASLDELVKAHALLNKRVHTYVVVGSMEMLKRGGRVSGTAALVGNVLNIKPVLLINEEGKLEPLAKVRGWKKVTQFLVERYLEFGDPELAMALAHGKNQAEMDRISAGILGEKPRTDILKMEIGAVIGSHVGPGTVGMVLFEKGDFEVD